MNKLPLGGRIIISPIEKKEEKIGSIVIPGTANAELLYGKVEAVSPDLSNIYKKDDIVLYPKGAGSGQIIDGKAHLWLRADPDSLNTEVWGIEKED